MKGLYPGGSGERDLGASGVVMSMVGMRGIIVVRFVVSVVGFVVIVARSVVTVVESVVLVAISVVIVVECIVCTDGCV